MDEPPLPGTIEAPDQQAPFLRDALCSWACPVQGREPIMNEHVLLLDLPMPLYLDGLPALGRSSLMRMGASRGRVRPGSGMLAGDGLPLGQRIHDAVLLPPADEASMRALATTDAAEAGAARPDEAHALRAVLARDAWQRAGYGSLVDEGLPELTVAWRDAASGLWCKARPDLLDPRTRTIWELKTVPQQSRPAVTAFLSQPRNVLQAAMYRAALRELTGRQWRFTWLAIETVAPRRIEPHALAPHLARQGEWLMRDALGAARARGARTPLDAADWLRWSVDGPRRARLVAAGEQEQPQAGLAPDQARRRGGP